MTWGTSFRAVVLAVTAISVWAPHSQAQAKQCARTSYLGFDRNPYPGDDGLKSLRRSFSFAGFWLNNPPGESTNSWAGKRQKVEDSGFGFAVLFNGRTFAQIKAAGDARTMGRRDGVAAVTSARHEGFRPKTIIFLDQEQGGRLLPEQRAYLHAWVDAVHSGGYRAGVYCSGIAFQQDSGVITAEDIRENANGRELTYWVTEDQCPPSPGCALPSEAQMHPEGSGISFADVWQFAQSPRRKEFSRGCPATHASDGNCYAPGDKVGGIYVDLDVATSADPSHARSR